MKEKRPSPVMRLLQWAGPERKWLILSVLCAFGSGILVITSYIGIYRLMDAVLSGACTKAVIADCALLVTAGTVGRLVLLGTSGVLSHKGAYWLLWWYPGQRLRRCGGSRRRTASDQGQGAHGP